MSLTSDLFGGDLIGIHESLMGVLCSEIRDVLGARLMRVGGGRRQGLRLGKEVGVAGQGGDGAMGVQV